jgi:hypothetical protein
MPHDLSIKSSAKCTIFVDLDVQNLSKVLATLPEAWQRFALGQELSNALLSEGVNRTMVARQWLEKTLISMTPGPVICMDIDLLFEPSLALDPLVIFQHIARHTKLVVLWPGNYKDGVLSYASPEHSHYRFWRNPQDVEIIGVSDAL